jgi:hypothetical protein
MKASRCASQASNKSKADRFLNEPKGESSKNNQQREGAILRGRHMMNCTTSGKTNLGLKLEAFLELPVLDKFSQLFILLQLEQVRRRHAQFRRDAAVAWRTLSGTGSCSWRRAGVRRRRQLGRWHSAARLCDNMQARDGVGVHCSLL